MFGMAAQYVISDLARIPVRVERASEFRYKNPLLDANNLVIVISQSGETTDTLATLREAKSRGNKTIVIVKVVGLSIDRETDYVIYTVPGSEILETTTKVYSCQLVVTSLFAIEFVLV